MNRWKHWGELKTNVYENENTIALVENSKERLTSKSNQAEDGKQGLDTK